MLIYRFQNIDGLLAFFIFIKVFEIEQLSKFVKTTKTVNFTVVFNSHAIFIFNH